MATSITVENAEQIKRQVEDALGQVSWECESAIMITQDEIIRKAKARAPIGTPQTTGIPDYIISQAYQRSLTRLAPRRTATKFVADVSAGGRIVNPNTGREVDYAIPLEKGSSRQAPHGVLVPSLYESLPTLRRQILMALKRVIIRRVP